MDKSRKRLRAPLTYQSVRKSCGPVRRLNMRAIVAAMKELSPDPTIRAYVKYRILGVMRSRK